MGLVGSKCTRECAGGGGGGRDGRRTSSSPYSTPTRLSSESGGGLDASSAPSSLASSVPRSIEERRSSNASEPSPLLLDRCRGGGGHTLRDLLRAHIAAQLRALGPEADIAAPAGCDEDLWVDIHVVDFCNEVDVLWRKVDDRCAAKCGDAPMRAGNRVYDCHVAVNAFFKRFVVFSLRHDLIGPADLEPVAELVQNLLRTHKKPPPPPSTPAAALRVAPAARRGRADDVSDRVLAALSEKPPQITLDFCALLRSAHGVSSVDDIEFTEYNENIEFAEEDVDARLPSMSLNFVNTSGRPGLAPRGLGE
ncbi:hypothetical protein JL721_5016 [Aureococcus anophagefferens]|nr:hypothetical protein JL721_5016 [Aureococcus anophagefferens]